MGWNRATIGRELAPGRLFLTTTKKSPTCVDMFVTRCAMCCGLCGKLRFIIMLVVWACDVIRIELRLYCFLPLKAATVRAQDKHRQWDNVLLRGNSVKSFVLEFSLGLKVLVLGGVIQVAVWFTATWFSYFTSVSFLFALRRTNQPVVSRLIFWKIFWWIIFKI